MDLSHHNPMQEISVQLCAKTIFISLHFDKAQYKLAQGDNRVKRIFKITPISPIRVPKNLVYLVPSLCLSGKKT